MSDYVSVTYSRSSIHLRMSAEAEMYPYLYPFPQLDPYQTAQQFHTMKKGIWPDNYPTSS